MKSCFYSGTVTDKIKNIKRISYFYSSSMKNEELFLEIIYLDNTLDNTSVSYEFKIDKGKFSKKPKTFISKKIFPGKNYYLKNIVSHMFSGIFI